MAESENFKNAIKAIQSLTADELNSLVPFWKQAAKMKRSLAGAAVVQKAGFKHGDILRWSSQKRGRPQFQYIRFTNMNRALTCVVGMECDAQGNDIPSAPGKTGKWTIGVSFVNAVNGQPLVK